MLLLEQAMTVSFVGTTFAANSDWHQDEKNLIANIKLQIEQAFPNSENLLINTTWFGPQFNNTQWSTYQQLISKQQFDCVFLLAAADPVFLSPDQIKNIQLDTQAKLYLLGHFDSEYYFNFHSQVLPKYFVKYSTDQLELVDLKYTYVNYNRKPRDHRSDLVNQLCQEDLLKYGVVTLGKQNNIYSKETVPSQHLTLNETPNDAVGNWGLDMSFGIPHDIHSLGNMQIWQQHFLNVVGETEFLPWDNMFISEKTWKPILGLRPFVINGQTKIYQYLRDQGFRTFEKYFNNIALENIPEYQVHDSIVAVIKYLCSLSKDELISMYQLMLPDLIHNRNRFFEFSTEQTHKIGTLFT
jgi:hypothetical protein